MIRDTFELFVHEALVATRAAMETDSDDEGRDFDLPLVLMTVSHALGEIVAETADESEFTSIYKSLTLSIRNGMSVDERRSTGQKAAHMH